MKLLEKRIFPHRLRELRKENKLSQAQLAKAIGVCQSEISLLENGNRRSTAEVLVKLANYFNTSIDYLIGRTGRR